MLKNKLSAEEVQQVLAICNESWFASLPPAQIVPALADKCRYIASESTFYRVRVSAAGRAKEHSRPRVSNDNAHVESLFETLKYVPEWSEKGVSTLEEARAWVETFVDWYNEEHRHSSICYVTPGQCHRGEVGHCWRR